MASSPARLTPRLLAAAAAVVLACLCGGVAGTAAYFVYANRAAAAEPAVEYILDASPRMAQAGPAGQDTRFGVARAVLAEIVRPADGRVSAALRVFGAGDQLQPCADTRLVVPLAPATQGRIATELTAVQTGQAADAALAEAMLNAIRDLSAAGGPHTLVVVTGGTDSCNPQAGQLVAQEAERAGIELETFVVGFMVTPEEGEAIRGLVADTPGATYVEAHDRAGLEAILKAIQARVDDPDANPAASIVATAQALPPVPTPGLDLTLEEAADIVEDEVIIPGELDHPILVFPWPEPLDPDDLLFPFFPIDLGGPPDPLPIPKPSWFFWIDDFPGGKYAHPVRFVLVDIDTGEVTVSEQRWWPVLNNAGLWTDPVDYWNEDNWSFSNFGARPTGGFGSGAPLALPARWPARDYSAPAGQGGGPVHNPSLQVTSQAVALVVNAWGEGQTGAAALAVDGAGVRAAFARSGLATTYLGPTTDPARDGDYSPTAVTNWLAERSVQLVTGDTLVLYLTGHGDGTALAGLSPAALQAALRQLDAGVHLIVILDSSYSGAFIPPLSTAADRLITATSAELPALFDIDPANDPNPADTGSEFTSGFVAYWEGLLNDATALSGAQQRALDETRPLWDVLAELSFHGAVGLDAGALGGQTAPQMVPAQQPTPTPTFTPTPTLTSPPPTATFTLVPSATPTRRPPTATFTPTPTPTITPTPQPFLRFSADTTSLSAGQCTTLRWDSGNIQSLFLDQQGVIGTGSQQVCPTATRTYTMIANHAGGQIVQQVTITVAVPPPTFGNHDASPSTFYTSGGCGATQVTLYISVNGSADKVTLFYRIAGTSSAWFSLPASPASATVGGVWSRTVLASDMPEAVGTMEYYFTASNAGGTAQSPVFSDVVYTFCIT